MRRCSSQEFVYSTLSPLLRASRDIDHKRTSLESHCLAMGGSHHDPAPPVTCGEQRQELVMGLSHRPASLIPSVPLPTSVRPETGNKSDLIGKLKSLMYYPIEIYMYYIHVRIYTFSWVNLSSLRCRIRSCLVELD